MVRHKLKLKLILQEVRSEPEPARDLPRHSPKVCATSPQRVPPTEVGTEGNCNASRLVGERLAASRV
jgi:hypothetical protein